MQEKKNKRLLILLLVLLSATAAVLWFGQRDNSFAIDKTLFKKQDLKTIDRITLESEKDTVELALVGSRWSVNKQYEADANMIDVLFATLQQAEPKRPVAISLQDSIAKAIVQNGVKVTLWSGGKSQEAFYAGGNQQKTRGIFKHEGDNQSYQMIIPGYRVYVSGIFELNENGWRDKRVFNFNWRNFQQLEVAFADASQNDFTAAMDRGYFGIKGMVQTDTTKMNDFLDRVSLLTVSEYLSNETLTDSLFSSRPFMQITVKDIASKAYTVQLFEPIKANSPFAGLIDGKQRALFSVESIREVVRPKGFFKP